MPGTASGRRRPVPLVASASYALLARRTHLSLMHLLLMHQGKKLTSAALIVAIRHRELAAKSRGWPAETGGKGRRRHSYSITSCIDSLGDSHGVNSPLGARCITATAGNCAVQLWCTLRSCCVYSIILRVCACNVHVRFRKTYIYKNTLLFFICSIIKIYI